MFRQSLSIFVLTLILLQFSGCAPKIQAVEDFNAIKKTFRDFQTAVDSHQGTKAVQYVAEPTIERFEQFRNWALMATPEEFESLSLNERIEVLKVRHYFTEAELSGMTGQELLAQEIEKDILSTPFLENSLIAEPVFKGDRAFLRIFDDRGSTKEKFTFLRENDGWKLDLKSLEYVLQKGYAHLIETKEMSEDDVIETVVSTWEDDIDISTLKLPLESPSS